MATWFIVLLVILLVFFFFRVRSFKHKFVAIAIVLLILFFYFTVPKFLPDGTNLKSVTGIETFFKVYTAWLVNAFTNLKTVVGNAIGLDWSPGNSTIK